MESGTFEWCWICACLQSQQSFNWLQSIVPAFGGGDWPIWELLQLFSSANVWICQPPCIYSAFNKKKLHFYTKKENVLSAFPANWNISCSAVLKLLLIWKKTVSPMEILSRPLVVIPIKHQKKTQKTRKHNGSLEQMVKICNQSLIVTWLLVLLFWKCCSLISLKKKGKWKEFRFAHSNHRPTVSPRSLIYPKFFLLVAIFY